MKYIIMAILASVGLIAGAWNWMNYFKVQSAVDVPQVQAVRPAPKPEIAAIEQQNRAGPVKGMTSDKQPTDSTGLKIDLPDTVGRNPFFTPEEIELIASGRYVAQAPAQQAPLPGLKLTALLQDNVSGDYVALIGGKAYREGDMVGSEQVVEITGTSVVLEQGGHRRTINLKNQKADKGVSIQMRKN